MKRQVLSLDLGSSSGRAILGSFDGVRLEAREVARFTTSLDNPNMVYVGT